MDTSRVVLRPERKSDRLLPDAQRQFLREAKILANLSHPNLPRVTDYFLEKTNGQYLVMDFVEGQDLQQMLEDRGGPFSEGQAAEWASQISDALAYLHSQSPPIIHRDIKPANIRITPAGKAVLVDFGIAKVFDPQVKTTVGARAVSPGYSPVEQYGIGKTDRRTDIYALGATLYTLLTGVEPPESTQRGNDHCPPPDQSDLLLGFRLHCARHAIDPSTLPKRSEFAVVTPPAPIKCISRQTRLFNRGAILRPKICQETGAVGMDHAGEHIAGGDSRIAFRDNQRDRRTRISCSITQPECFCWR
jgi:serine/threonine protein kinase